MIDMLENLAKFFGRQSRRIQELEHEVKKCHEEVERCIGRIERLESRCNHNEDEIRRNGRSIGRALAFVNEQRDDVFTEQDNRHVELARRYEDFRDQRISPAASDAVASGEDKRRDPQRHAEVTAELCRALFATACPDLQAVGAALKDLAHAEVLATELVEIARELVDEAARVGGSPYWDFDAPSGGAIDLDLQKLWYDSAEDGVLHMVVTPAYRARGRQFCVQYVRTVPAE
ncbi:hypothetical protein ABZ532_23730 [Streptomyces sp. NPDC019396]|uniref:hypothetical protein n=1 Tax=Streptomyces sp. NPDC019396 TaxID=3154687 RepID=UPI0034068E8F